MNNSDFEKKESRKEPSADVFDRAAFTVRALFYVLLFWLIQKIVGLFYSFALYFSVFRENPSASAETLQMLYKNLFYEKTNIIIAVTDFTAILVTLVIYLVINRKNLTKSSFCEWYSVKPVKALNIFIALLTGFFLNYALNILMSFVPKSMIDDYDLSSEVLTQGSVLWVIVGTSILAPIAEEIFFRSLMLTRMKKAIPEWAAIITGGVIFGIGHGQIVWIAYASLLGILFGFVFSKTESVLVSMALHIGFNSQNIIPIFLDRKFDISKTMELIRENGGSVNGIEASGQSITVTLCYMSVSSYLIFISVPLAVLGVIFLVKWGNKQKQSDGEKIVKEEK